MKNLALLFVLSLFSMSAFSQSKSPCQSPEWRQFDFWVGDWVVYQTGTDKIVGYNEVKSILNSCVIEENWAGIGGSIGKSFNTYNPIDSTWNQVWVDGSGTTIHFKGKYKDRVMNFSASQLLPSDFNVQYRLIFENKISNQSVRQVWKMSSDNGKNWEILFDGTYRKKK